MDREDTRLWKQDDLTVHGEQVSRKIAYIFKKNYIIVIIIIIKVGKPTGKRPLGSPRQRREDNIRMDHEEIGINAQNWVDSAQDRDYWRAFVYVALNLQSP